jgi:hypothetical protein
MTGRAVMIAGLSLALGLNTTSIVTTVLAFSCFVVWMVVIAVELATT